MSSKVGGVGESSIGLNRVADFDKIIARETEKKEASIKKVQDRLDIFNEKAVSLAKLSGLVQEYSEVLEEFSNPITGAFEKKSASLSTNDNGVGADYLDIVAENGSAKGSFNVAVEQIAKPAKLILGCDNLAGFDVDVSNLDGTLRLTVNAVNYDVALVATDSLNDVIGKINNSLNLNNVKFEAFYIKNAATSKAHIEIRAKAGEVNNIAYGWTANPLSSLIGTVSNAASQKAKIQVDGIVIESDSNEFKDVIPGINITVKKENNNPGVIKQQTVTISEDSSKFASSLEKIQITYNKLAIFIAEQKQELEADPENPDAPKFPALYGNNELGLAEGMLQRFSSAYYGKSLNDLGMNLKVVPGLENVPAGTKLLIVDDEVKYKNALKDITVLKNFFLDGANKNVSAALNQGSTLFFSSCAKELSSVVAGKDFDVNVTIIAGVITASATLPDGVTVVAGKVENSGGIDYIIFEDGNALAGLKLAFFPKGLVNATEKFTLNVTNGVVNLSLDKSYDLVSDDKTNGFVTVAMNQAKTDTESRAKEIAKMRAELKATTAKLEAQKVQVSQMDMMAGMLSNAISGLLNPSNN